MIRMTMINQQVHQSLTWLWHRVEWDCPDEGSESPQSNETTTSYSSSWFSSSCVSSCYAITWAMGCCFLCTESPPSAAEDMLLLSLFISLTTLRRFSCICTQTHTHTRCDDEHDDDIAHDNEHDDALTVVNCISSRSANAKVCSRSWSHSSGVCINSTHTRMTWDAHHDDQHSVSESVSTQHIIRVITVMIIHSHHSSAHHVRNCITIMNIHLHHHHHHHPHHAYPNSLMTSQWQWHSHHDDEVNPSTYITSHRNYIHTSIHTHTYIPMPVPRSSPAPDPDAKSELLSQIPVHSDKPNKNTSWWWRSWQRHSIW